MLVLRRYRWWLIVVVAVVALGIAAIPKSSAPKTADQRVDHLAQEIRCPTCAGLSVQQSDAPLAQSSKEEIRTRVTQGQSDDQIKGYFVSRYGNTALMNPGHTGINLFVWLLPAITAVVLLTFVVLIARRWSQRTYVEHVAEVAPAAVSLGWRGMRKPSFAQKQRTFWAVGAAVIVAFGVVAITKTIGQRQPGDTVTGSVSANSSSLLTKAEDQTSKGKAADAVKTYDQVLKIDPANAQALAYRGWLIRLAGLQDQGLDSINKAIAAQPTYADAHFFRGYILLNDKLDPNGAITEFQAFLNDNPPQQLVPLVQDALKDAQARAAVAH